MIVRVVMWIAVACYAATLLTLTHVPKAPSAFEGMSDKKLHFSAYLMLGALVFSATALSVPRQRGLVSMSIFFCGLFAIVDEATQPFFGRHADVHDWGADICGVLAAVWFLGLIRLITSRVLSETPRAATS
jgi:VanZ family protein